MSKKYRLVCYHDKGRKAEILELGDDDEHPKGWAHISYGHPTIAELYEKEPLAPEPCSVCGSPYSLAYSNKVSLIKHKMCFSCDFWRGKIEQRTPDHVCVAGHFYRLATGSPSENRVLGHGGREFFVRRHGEAEIKVFNNVWHAGEIPPAFRDRLKDDADFLSAPFRVEYQIGEQWHGGKGFLTAQQAWASIKGDKEGFRVVDSDGKEQPPEEQSQQ